MPLSEFPELPHAPLIIDVAGLGLTPVDRARLRHPLVGGMILFGRNWRRSRTAIGLCADIKRLRDLLILVDHEGGRVQRFSTDGFTHLPPMASLGQMWLQASRAIRRPVPCRPRRPRPPVALSWAPNCAPVAST
jgi:beta-N-acetylhexosaminidase